MFLTLKLKKAWIFVLTAVIIILCTGAHLPHAAKSATGADILRTYGYEVKEPPMETLTVTLPYADDPVFETYNDLQKKSGFDLTPYAGRTVTRVTFEVVREGTPFLGNLLFDGDAFIGGDICTVDISGEMYSLGE